MRQRHPFRFMPPPTRVLKWPKANVNRSLMANQPTVNPQSNRKQWHYQSAMASQPAPQFPPGNQGQRAYHNQSQHTQRKRQQIISPNTPEKRLAP